MTLPRYHKRLPPPVVTPRAVVLLWAYLLAVYVAIICTMRFLLSSDSPASFREICRATFCSSAMACSNAVKTRLARLAFPLELAATGAGAGAAFGSFAIRDSVVSGGVRFISHSQHNTLPLGGQHGTKAITGSSRVLLQSAMSKPSPVRFASTGRRVRVFRALPNLSPVAARDGQRFCPMPSPNGRHSFDRSVDGVSGRELGLLLTQLTATTDDGTIHQIFKGDSIAFAVEAEHRKEITEQLARLHGITEWRATIEVWEEGKLVDVRRIRREMDDYTDFWDGYYDYLREAYEEIAG